MGVPRHLIFALEDRQFALPLRAVERVLPAADITPLPALQETLLGVLNYRGRVIPVLNLRRRLRIREAGLKLSDVLILARSRTRPLLLPADRIVGVDHQGDDEILPAAIIAPDLAPVQGVLRRAGDLIVIHDPDLFLSLTDDAVLGEALRNTGLLLA
jgi:purine-binding chemotaxis protein CheW